MYLYVCLLSVYKCIRCLEEALEITGGHQIP